MIDNLCCCEGSTQVADSLSICFCLFLDLKKLCSLNERLESVLNTADCESSLCQPLLQLPNIVPKAKQPEEQWIQPSTTRKDVHLIQLQRAHVMCSVLYLICRPLLQEHMSLRSSRWLSVTAQMM